MKRIGDTLPMLTMLSAHNSGLFKRDNAQSTRPPCTAADGRFAFGGATSKVVVAADKFSAVARAVDMDFCGLPKAERATSIPKARIDAWKRNAAFIEMSLAIACNAPPVDRMGGNVFWLGDTWVRARKAKNSGDCFVDYFEGRWKSRRVDALHSIGEILGEDKFSAILCFLEIVERHLHEKGIFTSFAAPIGGHSRISILRLHAKHKGLQFSTRFCFAVVWLAARGRAFGNKKELIAAAVRICGEKKTEYRRGEYALGAFSPKTLEAILSGGMKWSDFCAWSAALIGSLPPRRLSQFRCLFIVWRKCLSKDGANWRWAGFHNIFGGGRGGNALKLSRMAGCGKRAAADAIFSAKTLGFLVIKGVSACLALGWWGKRLTNNLYGAISQTKRDGFRTKAILLRLARRFLPPNGGLAPAN